MRFDSPFMHVKRSLIRACVRFLSDLTDDSKASFSEAEVVLLRRKLRQALADDQLQAVESKEQLWRLNARDLLWAEERAARTAARRRRRQQAAKRKGAAGAVVIPLRSAGAVS